MPSSENAKTPSVVLVDHFKLLKIRSIVFGFVLPLDVFG